MTTQSLSDEFEEELKKLFKKYNVLVKESSNPSDPNVFFHGKWDKKREDEVFLVVDEDLNL